jgi:hypothetical protein
LVVVLVEGDVVPVATAVPPDATVYHLIEFAFVPGVAVIVPGPQEAAFDADGFPRVEY